jgi:hypothetical protein
MAFSLAFMRKKSASSKELGTIRQAQRNIGL